jgi:hypothetical protein
MLDVCINLVFEDALSGVVAGKILACAQRRYIVGIRYPGGGFGWIKKRIDGFNHAARGMPYLILTDLDTSECAPVLIKTWLKAPKHPNLLLRVAVREIETWVMGCRDSFAAFLGVQDARIPSNVDDIADPKEFVIRLARRSRKRDIRRDIVPQDGSTARVGPNYNGRLMSFVEKEWNPMVAREYSISLKRAMRALDVFEPVFGVSQNRGKC